MWILFKFKFIIKLSKNASLIVCNQDQGLCAASLGHKLNELWCCWHFAGLDGSQLGSKRAVVYSHDKKKDSYTEGYFEEETPVVLMISNMFALESCETRTSVLISDTLCLWSGLLKLFLLKTKRKKNSSKTLQIRTLFFQSHCGERKKIHFYSVIQSSIIHRITAWKKSLYL